jgi:hypothetical protein
VKSNLLSLILAMKKRLNLIILFIPLLLLCSCGKQTLSVTSRTFADSQLIPNGFPVCSSFCILPAGNQNQLFAKEVTRKITLLIKKEGYEIADQQDADFYLFFSTNIESFTGTTNVPLYIPGQTQTTNGSVYGYRGAVQYQQQTQSSGSFTYVPQQYTVFNSSIAIPPAVTNCVFELI